MNSRPQRLVSLDAFRGLTIALMILVNNPGSGATYAQLQHTEWNGLTLADTIFPTFLWIAGVSLALSLVRRIENGAAPRMLLKQVCKRAAVLYLLGLLIYALPDFDLAHLRIMGVLQRSAICYFVASLICLGWRWRGQICWIVGLLGVYWLAIMLIPVPSYGPGNLSMEGNLAHYLDRIVLGNHNYAETRTWDPEGLLSTLPAIATTLLGVAAGHILRNIKIIKRQSLYLAGMGMVLLASGLVCALWLPVNKKLWTDSFALLMAGIDSLTFLALMWLCELQVVRDLFRPLAILGMNAIAVYVSAELVSVLLDNLRVAGRDLHGWIFRAFFTPLSSPRNASLLFSIAFVLAMFGIAYQLHKRSLYLRA